MRDLFIIILLNVRPEWTLKLSVQRGKACLLNKCKRIEAALVHNAYVACEPDATLRASTQDLHTKSVYSFYFINLFYCDLNILFFYCVQSLLC